MFPTIPYPIDVQFATPGLLIYDYAEKRLHVLEAATGRQRFAVGRRGSGPAEFGDRPVTLFGRFAAPMGVEFSDGRITTLANNALANVRVSRDGRWATGCDWGAGKVILQTSGHEQYDYFVSTIGENPRVIDSVAAPWTRYRSLPFIVRQGMLRQVDDSTCAILPAYQEEFALLGVNRAPRLGRHVETLPEAKAVEGRTAKMRVSGLAKGAKSGAVDLRSWRGYILVLFEGTTKNRGRTVDVYDRQTLSYQGSVLLPHNASRFAIRGDTMVVVGDVDDEPIVAAFTLSPTRAKAGSASY